MPQTLLERINREEGDTRQIDSLASNELERIKQLERENKELHLANDFLDLGSAFLPKRRSTADSSS